PPIGEQAWLQEFAKYQQSPEYIQKNIGMSLHDFKHIFFWEWAHRLLGRIIGIAFAVPLFFFWITNRVADGYKAKFLGVLALGGLQGAVGWWMVASGLIDNPAVSHYRLATHLGLAVILYAFMLWMALTLLRRDGKITPPPIENTFCLRRHGWAALLLVAITMIWGAFTAGLDAGLIYNEWPLMGGRFMPSEMWFQTPAWLNLFENHASVQFTHRWLAIIAAFLVLGFAWRTKFRPLAAAVFIQVGLGITTLLSSVMIPIAAAHQAGALITLGLLIYQLNRITISAQRT
ncbi:MAG TPA: COX15/CtaA family protein, partial [Alphaproteobacteria bacterium]